VNCESLERSMWISILSFFSKQEPGSVWVWQAERRSESECAQVMRHRMLKRLSHLYTTRSHCDLRAARTKSGLYLMEVRNQF